jgi:hypothetical protein
MIKNRHIVNCFVTHFQNHRKRAGLRPWNKVDLVIIKDADMIIKSQLEIFESRTNVPVFFECDEEKYNTIYSETYTHSLESGDVNIAYLLCVY